MDLNVFNKSVPLQSLQCNSEIDSNADIQIPDLSTYDFVYIILCSYNILLTIVANN